MRDANFQLHEGDRMRSSLTIAAALLCAGLFVTGCAKKESAVDNAVDSTKDALNIREHEKLKDAGEDAKAAVDNAAEGVKDEVNDKKN